MGSVLAVGILLTMQGQYIDHWVQEMPAKECHLKETPNGKTDIITLNGIDMKRIVVCYKVGENV